MAEIKSLVVPQIVSIASKDANLYEALKQMIQHNNSLHAQITAQEARIAALESGRG